MSVEEARSRPVRPVITVLLPLVFFAALIGELYWWVGQKKSSGDGAAFMLSVAATFPLLDGGRLLSANAAAGSGWNRKGRKRSA